MMELFSEEPLLSLCQAWARGHRHPGYLLIGAAPADFKRQAALAMAGWILCKSFPEAACGACLSCQQVRAGTHPDCKRVAPDGKWIKVEQIRAIQAQVALAPFGNGSRVIIIEEAEQLGLAAANAFLKTLEEPPARCTFFLIAPTTGALSATIVSRLQRLTFPPRAVADVTAEHEAADLQTFIAPLAQRGTSRAGLMKTLDEIAKDKNPAARSRVLDLYENYLRRVAAGKAAGPYSPRTAAEALVVVTKTRRQLADSTASAGLQMLSMLSRLIQLAHREI